MKKGTHVCISKEWHHPSITIDVRDSRGSLDLKMELADFLQAVVAEVGNPATIMTKAQLERRLFAAADVVTSSMKQETTAVA